MSAKNTMKYIILLMALMPLYCFSQESITGIWSKSPQSRQALQFNQDGTFKLINLQDRNETVLKQIVVKYKLVSENGASSIEYTYYKNDRIVNTESVKYKLENGDLYLPKETEINGVVKTEEYADIYHKVNE